MMERTVTLGSKSGLHNGKSILSVLTLGAEQGDQVILKIDGDDAQFAIDKLVPLLEGDLG
ncbi:MAG: hypothetical protein AUG45_03615 [Ktedonobacter sp. 13_1_20CM_3_54_15]|nr:MAG: hypothetical protein AUG45_03615 [Ktedonobacter sp. 13_1_20CM_3_54_15]